MTNSNRFAIVIDTKEKVPSLIDVIRELGFVERSVQQQLTPALLEVNKLLVFNKKDNYDYKIEQDNNLIISSLNDIFGQKTYKVSKNFEEILEELHLCAGKERKSKNNMKVNITISVPKKVAKKHKVRVFTNFVKVGWDQYSIKRDFFTDREYVIIKGNRYEIVRNIFGQGYLDEL